MTPADQRPVPEPAPTRHGVRLGVDVGEARVGLAASDPAGLLAVPVQTVTRDHDGASDVDRIVQEVAARDAIEVVVGLPRTLSGQEGVAADRARDYAGTLHRRLAKVPVRLWDERLTTVDAHRMLRDSGVAGRRQRATVDQAAAVLILQSALDAERSTGAPAGQTVGGRKPRTARSARRDEGLQS